jgi:hypothetical protein
MPLFSEDTNTRSILPLDEIPSTFSDVINAQFTQGRIDLPSVALDRMRQLSDAQDTGTLLQKPEADEVVRAAGLENHLKIDDAGISNNALSLLIERKNEELRIQQTLARARGGVGEGAARLGVALGTSLLDPVNVASAFIPVVGEARYGRLLASAGGLGGRTAVRAGIGAAEGAVGAAVVEPIIYTSKMQEQADYDMSDSLMNVAFGTLFGGGLHAIGGAGLDAYRAMRGRGEIPPDVPELLAGLDGESPIPRAEKLSTAERGIETRLANRIDENLDSAISEYAQLPESEGGRILNTDVARELSPEYRADRTKSAAVHEPASYLVKRMYERKLAEVPGPDQDARVLFSAGGTGAGKTTALEHMAGPMTKRAQIIYDTNMNTLDSAVRRVEQALKAGKEVSIMYTWRDPVDALTNGSLPRAMRMGRTVPINEHAKTHVGAAKVVKQLAELYAGDERVTVQVLDNSHGKGNVKLGSVDQVPELEYTRVREDLETALEQAHQSGAISDAVYRGSRATDTAGESPRGVVAESRARDGGELEPQDAGTVSAATRADEVSPQVREAALRTAVGQVADGKPVNVESLFSPRDEIATAAARDATAPDVEAPRAEARSKAIDEEVAQSNTELEAAEQEAALAEQQLNAQSKFNGLEPTDPAMEAAAELAKKAERWSRAAELATNCLIRGA